jgi:hypothetical protein
MLELPTFKTALPLEIEAEFTVPLTELPLLSVPVTVAPIRLPAEAMLWPSATDCKVLVNCWLLSIAWIWLTWFIKSVLLIGCVGSWFCNSVTSILVKSSTLTDCKGLLLVEVELVVAAALPLDVMGVVAMVTPYSEMVLVCLS